MLDAAALAFPLLLGLAAPAVAQELPPDIQVDRFMVQADRQIANREYMAALRTLDRVLELHEEHDVELPDSYWMKRAEGGLGAEDYLEAIASATRYLELAGREGEQYGEALGLLDRAVAEGCMPAGMTETLESVSACLAAGADPNGVGEDGRTALDWAAARENPAITAALIAAGADPAVAVDMARGGWASGDGDGLQRLCDMSGDGGGARGQLHDGVAGIGGGAVGGRRAAPPRDDRDAVCGGRVRGDVRGVGRMRGGRGVRGLPAGRRGVGAW